MARMDKNTHTPKRHKIYRPPHPDALSYGIDEAAHVLGLSRTTMYVDFINTGRIATHKVGTRRLIDREDLAKLHAELKAGG